MTELTEANETRTVQYVETYRFSKSVTDGGLAQMQRLLQFGRAVSAVHGAGLMTRPVSGRQFTVRRGDAVVQVGEVAAVLREFSVGRRAFHRNLAGRSRRADGGRHGAGAVAEPGGRSQLDPCGKGTAAGHHRTIQGNAIHGLLRNTAYRLVEQAEDSVTLTASVYPQHGYPFILDLDVTYTLTDEGLQVTYRLLNAGAAVAPFGIGSHPYLRVGDYPAADLTITVAAATHAVVDDRMIPVSRESVTGTHIDLRSGIRVGDLKTDASLTDIDLVDGRVEHRLSAPDGTSVVLWADPAFGWVQVYSPDTFPGPGQPGQRVALAVEPMTCAVDALNSGDGLLWLEPGTTWSASWGLRPEGF